MTDSLEAKQILVMASYEYLNLPAIQSHLALHSTAHFHVATKNGLGHVLIARPGALDITAVNWKPSYSTSQFVTQFDYALLFWDGADHLLKPPIDYLTKHSIPFLIIGPDAKVVAPTRFYATFANGETRMPQAPSVIVDPPKPVEEYGKPARDMTARVRLQLLLPESVIHQYEQQASLAKQPLEKILADRLRVCADYTSGRGLYFNDEQRSHLERITGGHIIQDADIALAKIKTVVNLKVGDVSIELTERVLARCASRAKSERKTLEEYVRKEVIQGLERSTGLRPY